MRKSRFTETQIVSILKEADAGMPVNEVWRKHGISSATFYKWKAKYGGLEAEAHARAAVFGPRPHVGAAIQSISVAPKLPTGWRHLYTEFLASRCATNTFSRL